EAFVKPMISQPGAQDPTGEPLHKKSGVSAVLPKRVELSPPTTQQLKIALTGTTTSGKSTLLGTLTTSAPDNGRGTSRLSVLRHRHELVSGVTASVAPEIVGYKPYNASPNSPRAVVNYAS